MREDSTGSPGRILIPGIVRVHEDIRACLQFVVDPDCGLEFPRSGSRTRYQVTGDTVALEKLYGLAGQRSRGLSGFPPFRVIANVLRETVIRLETSKSQPVGGHHVPGEGDGLRARPNATTLHPDINFDQDVEARTDGHCRGPDGRHVLGVVDANPNLRLSRQRHEPFDLALTDDLVAYQDIRDTGMHQCFCLADLLAADSHGASGHLLAGDRGALVSLRVRPESRARVRNPAGHGVEVALEGVEVDQQGWGVDIGERRSDHGGRWSCHRCTSGKGPRSNTAFGGRRPQCIGGVHRLVVPGGRVFWRRSRLDGSGAAASSVIGGVERWVDCRAGCQATASSRSWIWGSVSVPQKSSPSITKLGTPKTP